MLPKTKTKVRKIIKINNQKQFLISNALLLLRKNSYHLMKRIFL